MDEYSPERPHDNFSPQHRAAFDQIYWHRPMLRIAESTYTNGPQLSVMTYNLLHPCSQKQYPISTMTRDQVLLCEITRYNPDIVCLQEVNSEYPWAEMFGRLKYNVRVYFPNQYHGVAICYRAELFEEITHDNVSFWDSDTGAVTELHPSLSGATFTCLKFKPQFLHGHSAPSRDAIIIGSTHLPRSRLKSLSRVRDAAILLKFAGSFSEAITANFDLSTFYTFIAGDFNSPVGDAAYVSLVSRPVHFSGWAFESLIESINNDFRTSDVNKPRHSELISKTPKAIEKLEKLEELHNSIHKKATSVYSVGYSLVHKANTQPGTNEPWFSLWADQSHELVDYIFVVSDWDGDSSKKVGTLAEFSETSDMRLMALLGMPTHEDMSEEVPQPVVGEFPSDHLCMMADFELL